MNRIAFAITIQLAIASSTFAQTDVSAGLVGLYPFEGNVRDVSGLQNHGTSSNVSYLQRETGSGDRVAHFSGELNQWISIPNAPSLNSSSVTFAVWCYNNRTNNSDVRFLCGKAYEQLEIHFGTPQNNASGLRFIPGNGAIIDTIGGTPTREWYHLVCTAGPGADTGKVYINGQEVSVKVAGDPASAIAASSAEFAIGMRGGNHGWGHLDGRLNNFRIYNRTLSASEVSQIYNYETRPRIDLVRALRPIFSNLRVGSEYQLQVSSDVASWTNHGGVFVATNSVLDLGQYWDVSDWGKLFFRLESATP